MERNCSNMGTSFGESLLVHEGKSFSSTSRKKMGKYGGKLGAKAWAKIEQTRGHQLRREMTEAHIIALRDWVWFVEEYHRNLE